MMGEGSQEANLICSIEHVDRQGMGEGVSAPDLTHSNAYVEGMDVEVGSQDADLICSIEHVDGQGVGEGVVVRILQQDGQHFHPGGFRVPKYINKLIKCQRSSSPRCHENMLHCKKGLVTFLSPAEMSLTKLSLGGNN